MTSRLKRKLDDIQDTGNVTESFVKYGTPLPALSETKKDRGEFVPIWKQEVRDEQGRRRLHGAWTGGFSAGYFNTVGSKEGWTPSTFKSSRSNKASSAQQTAEDFMDEEDLEDMRSSQKLQTNAEFDVLDGTAGEMARQGATAALKDLVEPSQDRIGEKLLRKMGWREGQGIGPRISAKTRRRQAAELGIRLDEDEVEDDEAKKHTFAPLDRELVVYDAKENMYGLGFRPGQTLHQALDEPKKGERTTGEGAARQMGGAWGLGAMEDADDDDFSVYDAGLPQNAGKVVLLDDDGDEGPSIRAQPAKKALQRPRDATSSSSVFNDGTPVIRHFVAASRSQPPDTRFEPPEIPKDWQPDPKRVFALTPRAPPQQPSSNGLDADQRGVLLGEEKLKAPLDSVFEYIAAKSKERMASFARSGGQPVTGANVQPLPEDAAPLEVPPLDPMLAAAALKGFLPFSDDLAKQARYKRYLEHHAGIRPDEAFAPWAAGGRVEELNRELEEFAASARIFTPMSNAMASRFTSSSVTTILNDSAPAPGLRKPAPAPAVEEVTPDNKTGDRPLPKATTAAGQAAREGRFGRLTRTITRFYPARLACKRFNVPDPYPDGPSAEDDALDSMSFTRKDDFVPDAPPLAITDGRENEPPREGPPKPLGSVGLGDDETQGRDTLTAERPPDALFKAIFADSDDEEEAEDPPAPATSVAPVEPVPAWKERVANEPVEPFKPTFVPKADRQSTLVSSSDKEKKKKKRDKAKAAALSFDIEGEGALSVPVKRSKSDKSEKRKKKKEAEEEWVEMPSNGLH